MPPALIKLFGKILLMFDKDVIVKLGTIFILLPFLFLLLFVMPVIFLLSIPFAGVDEINYYQEAAEIVNIEGEAWNMTKSEYDEYWEKLDWQVIVALDAVLLEQKFEKADKNSALDLARKFTRKVVGVKPVWVHDEDGYQEVEVSYLRFVTLDEIFEDLNFSEEEIELFYNYYEFDLKELLE